MRRNVFFVLITALIFGVTSANAQSYGGDAAAVKVTVNAPPVPILTTAVADTGQLPSAGGHIPITSASVNVAGVLTVADATVRTSGGVAGSPFTTVNTSRSLASINTLNVGLIGGNTITADVISSTASCSCPLSVCSGSSTITNLRVNGALVTVDGSINQDVPILGVGTLKINEQIATPGSLTVNALHLNITVAGVTTDVIIGASYSTINCTAVQAITMYSGRATGIRNRERSADLILIPPTDVTLLVSDTGFLPTSGGEVEVSTVGTTVLPGLLTSGTVTSNTYGGVPGGPVTDVNSSASNSTVENLNLNILGVVAVTADAVRSETRCTCGLAGSSVCTGDSILTNVAVTVFGQPVVNLPVSVPPNFDLSVLGLVNIIINEQTPVSPTSGGTITVNAIHISVILPLLAVSDTIIASSHSDIDCGVISTAANASISGRVLDAGGRGISNATVTATDQKGNPVIGRTNIFGYYRIEDVSVGMSYVVNVSTKRHSFQPRTVMVEDHLGGVDFTPEVVRKQ